MSAIGDPLANRLVVLCHPTAGAAGFDPDPVLTSTWGVHLVSFDRPGYGSSDPYPAGEEPPANRWADGIAAYLAQAESSASSVAHTDFGRVGVIGWREGGLFAAALAARHPEIVNRLAIVGCPALPRLAAVTAHDRDSWFDPDSLTPRFSERDTSAYERRVGRMMVDARLQGTAGVDADLRCFTGEAPSLSAVTADTLIAVGRRDAYATPTDARWFSESLPHSQTFVAERGGCDVIASSWERILEHVAPAHGDIAAIAPLDA